MKSLARPSFFRLFELLLSHGNPKLKLPEWTYEGVHFERERHSFTGPRHGLIIEIFTLTSAGRRKWTLMVTKETWWAGNEKSPVKSVRWAKPLGGLRSDMMTWLRNREAAFDQELARFESEGKGGVAHEI